MNYACRALCVILFSNLAVIGLWAQPQPAPRPGQRPLPITRQPPELPGRTEQIWYGSNLGSADLLDMFTSPKQWSDARSKIDVLLVSGSQVGSGGWSCTVLSHADCGDNYLGNLVAVDAFRKLGAWGIDIAVESFFAGPLESVNPAVCATDNRVLNLTLEGSINVVQNVQANGGVVKYLRMDEPLWRWYPADYYIQTGQADPRPCLASSLDEVADHVVAYIQQMGVFFPSVIIGHVELYPEVSVDTLKQWILILEARGISLPFLHVDVHYPRLLQYLSFGLDVDLGADMRELREFCEARGMDLGIIYTDVNWDSQLWDPADYTDQVYFESTVDFINQIESANIMPHHLVYQSWVLPYYTTGAQGARQHPVNLPESSPAVFSQMRLLNETY